MSTNSYNDFTNNDELLTPPYSDYEFSPLPYELLNSRSQLPPGGNFPGGNFPGGNPPGGFPGLPGFPNLPGSNFPGGPPGQGNMPKSPPPNYTPSKKEKGVQSLSSSKNTKAVSPNSIRFCLFKYTYIWEVSGRNYWTFLINVDRRSVSGFRWLGFTWVYFGLDLRRIDSFICYRSDNTCENCENLREDNLPLESSKKEYSINGTKNIYTKTLTSIDVPEVKEDYISQTIGYINDDTIESEIPCLKYRNTSYRIILDISYPDSYNESLKSKINEIANNASIAAIDTITSLRSNEFYLNPLEKFNASVSLIPEALIQFSVKFNGLLNEFNSYQRNDLEITYSIKEEKVSTNWQPYPYYQPLSY